MNDGEFSFEIAQRAKQFNCFATKIKFEAQSGAPDFLLVDCETGRSILFELKIRGDKMHAAQKLMRDKLQAGYNLLHIDHNFEFTLKGKNALILLTKNMRKLLEHLERHFRKTYAGTKS